MVSARPPPKLDPHQWAEANLTLPRGTSPEPGRWRSRAYQREILQELANPANTEGVLYVAASQGGGKTAIALAAMAYYIAAEPSPQLFVTYSLEMAAALSKHRVSQYIRQNECLSELVGEAKSRSSNNTIRDKMYPGGALTLVGANSPGGLSMHPKRVLIADEIDRWKESAGTEGSPFELALTRLKAYKHNARKLFVTSPGVKKHSESWRLWERSDQREWHVPCPDCGVADVLAWDQVIWEKTDAGVPLPETARYVCVHCGSVWSDAARWRASDAGFYRATAPFNGLYAGRVSALAIEGWTLDAMVRQWLRAQGNPEALKVFKTTVLCEWWVEDGFAELDETGLMARREQMVMRGDRPEIPARAALLTAGVDIQRHRFEVTFDAWGAGEECWRLGHQVVLGDPTGPAIWADLDALLMMPFPRELGGVDYVRGVGLDTGGDHTQTAYDFCGPRFRRMTPDGGRQFVFALKGMPGSGELWPRMASKATSKTPMWPIRVNPGKEQIYGRLTIAEPGPGYVHLPMWLDRKYFEGLTAERVIPKPDRKGFIRNTWEKKVAGGRNEPLDCAVYSYAALCGLRANGVDLDHEVEQLPHRLLFNPDAPVSTVPVPVTPVGARTRVDRSPSWLGNTDNWLGR